MSKLILVTVGTSALEHSTFENGKVQTWEKLEDLAEYLNQNGEDEEYNHQKDQALRVMRECLEIYHEKSKGLDRLSAELASLLAMEEAKRRDPSTGEIVSIGRIQDQDEIVLLYSDTIDGKLCAEVNEILLESDIGGRVICSNVQIGKIDGLQASDPEKFVNIGLRNLAAAIRNYSGRPDCYLNITGGFKGALPHAAELAWRNRMDVFYLFERSSGIILIPKLPPHIPIGGSIHGDPHVSI